MKHSSRLLSFACALTYALSIQSAWAVHERFESAEVSWRLADSDGSARLVAHQRDFTVAHSGQGSEHIRIWSAQGTYAYLAHPVAPARIIGELVPSLWVKADQPGLRLLLRVVLPRAKDREGKTLTVLLDGEFYTQVGAWQRLYVRNLKKTLEAEVRIRRLQLGQVDEREAYIDHVVLNAYTGPGTTDIWTDDLELLGYASSPRETTAVGLMGDSHSTTSAGQAVERRIRSVELRGTVLLVDNRPFFAKIIEHNGEPFSWLKGVGFNSVLLRSPPTSAQLAEAEEADLWLVAPPTIKEGLLDPASLHHRVIAWRLGVGASAAEAAAITNLAAQVRRQDHEVARPIVCDIARDTTRFAAVGDVFLMGRPVIGTSFDLKRYGDWLSQAARPLTGKPLWGTVQTEPSSRLLDQLAIVNARSNESLSATSELPKLGADPEQIRLLAFETIAMGARGVCFRSRSRLDLDDDVAKLRTASLRTINAELTLVEPWAAGGAFSGEVDLRDTQSRGRLLETDRSRLLVITRHESGQQYVPRPNRKAPISLLSHAVPITDQAYYLGPDGLQPLLQSLATGPRLVIHEPESVSLVLFTQDPLAINRSTRVLSENRKQLAELRQQMASIQMRQTLDVVSRTGRVEPAKTLVAQARAQLERAEQLLRAGDYKNSLVATRTTEQLVRRVQREAWEEAVLAFPSPASSILCSSFATLPLHAKATNRLAAATWATTGLPAGDCESLDAMLRSGWRQHAPESSVESTLVELSTAAPAGGRSALRMISRQTFQNSGSANDSPLSITSAPVAVVAGQCTRIHGWVKVPQQIVHSEDALMIYDSFSGEELAVRIQHTDGWREFTLYRVATQTRELTLTFALTGIGEAWLDEISVSVLK